MRLQQYTINEMSATQTTKLQEILFAVGFAISQIKGGITKESLLDTDLFHKAFTKHLVVDASEQEVFMFANDHPDWVESVVKGVKALRSNKVVHGSYTIFRTKDFMHRVYMTKDILTKKDGLSLNHDKWNPGDLWFAKKTDLPSFDSIFEFNEYLRQQLKKGNILPVSLKKSNNPKAVHVEQTGEMSPFQYIKVRKPRSMFNTGIQIQLNDKYVLNIRSFDRRGKAKNTSELIIQGGKARHGKAKLPYVIRKFNIPQTPEKQLERYRDNPELIIPSVVDMWRRLGYTFDETKMKAQWDKRSDSITQEFDKKGYDPVGYFISIINALEFGVYLEEHKEHADEIVTYLANYASSKTNISSDYIKVY